MLTENELTSMQEVNNFLFGSLEDQLNILQDNQWYKYDEECMDVKYSLFIKTIYDLLHEGWDENMLIDDMKFHISKFNENSNESFEVSEEMSEEEYLDKLEKLRNE